MHAASQKDQSPQLLPPNHIKIRKKARYRKSRDGSSLVSQVLLYYWTPVKLSTSSYTNVYNHCRMLKVQSQAQEMRREDPVVHELSPTTPHL